ncbi:hypothetical protein [Taibaiella koreensis]|uniref:hypothetical protein n=1 Tax=Taibaiella koreensis TaxID=1268548 RepID=UPI0013C2DCC3|nr:hypothetical protein [Taibaiella koreensis]
MKKKKQVFVKPINNQQCKLHQDLSHFLQAMHSPKDAEQALQDRPQCAPVELLPMVF